MTLNDQAAQVDAAEMDWLAAREAVAQAKATYEGALNREKAKFKAYIDLRLSQSPV